MPLLRIKGVQALPEFRLRLELSDGSIVEREISGLLSAGALAELRREPGQFAMAAAEAGSVAWPNGADVCPDLLIWGELPPAEPAKPPQFLALPRPAVQAA